MQNVVVGHETDLSERSVVTKMGADHEEPFQANAKPSGAIAIQAAGEAHESACMSRARPVLLGSMSTGADQFVPFQVSSNCPPAGSAIQNDEDVHVIDRIKIPGSMLTGADQTVPFHRYTLPPESATMQKADMEHETVAKLNEREFRIIGADHVIPFQIKASSPEKSPTATQNDEDEHDNDCVFVAVVPFTPEVSDHELPSHLNAEPFEVTTIQKDAVAQETS
jgi:hypothetical protein